jgi:hypothetical protein
MIYLLIIAASYGVYELQNGPKACNCATNQNALVEDKAVLYLKQENGKKCQLNLNFYVQINHEDDDAFLVQSDTVSLYSSIRGKISQQTVVGSRRIHLQENIVLKKKETLWVEVRSKGKYLVSLTSIR